MKDNNVKQAMNAMWGKGAFYANSPYILKAYNHKIELRPDEMTKEEIEEIMKNLHNMCFREHQHVLRYKFRKIDNADELKLAQCKMYHSHMRKSRIILCCYGPKETDPINETIMSMISKYGNNFLKSIALDSNGKNVDKSEVQIAIPCWVFNNNMLEILKESAIDDDKFNECVNSLPKTLVMEFHYAICVPIVES